MPGSGMSGLSKEERGNTSIRGVRIGDSSGFNAIIVHHFFWQYRLIVKY